MEQFSHFRTVFSMIISLSIAHLLKGAAKIIEHPARKKIYVVHLLWCLFVFLLIIDFWWWEINLTMIAQWNFEIYLFIIFYVILFYITSSVLFPDDLREYEGYKEYYYSRRGWIFGFMSLLFLADIGDTLLKGISYYKHLGIEYTAQIVTHFLLCILAIKIKKEWYHKGLVIVFLLYNIVWMFRKYHAE